MRRVTARNVLEKVARQLMRAAHWLAGGVGIVALLMGACLIILLALHRSYERQPRPTSPGLAQPPATGDDVSMRVEAEFKLHGEDCVVVSVYAVVPGCNGAACDWARKATFVDCGHGLVLSNPLP